MHLLPFLALSAVVVLTPGVDMALVTKNALLHGRAAAYATAVGVNLGIFFWTIAAALGLAAVVAASSTAFLAIKLAGALYLIHLGLKALRHAGESEPGGLSSPRHRVASRVRGAGITRPRSPHAPAPSTASAGSGSSHPAPASRSSTVASQAFTPCE